MKNIKEIFNELNVFYCDFYDIPEEDSDLLLDETSGLIQTFSFIFRYKTDESPFVINFNEELPTSALLNLCAVVVPFIETMVDESVFIGECFYPVLKKEKCVGLLMESQYEKNIKELKK